MLKHRVNKKMSFKLANVTTIYAENPNLKKKDVDTLSKWAKSQPHLPEIEELQIILFYHSCYYDLEKAQTTIENYFNFRTTSDLCQNVTEEVIRRTLNVSFLGFMPKKTSEGDAILVTKMLDYRPEVYNCLEVTTVMVAIITVYLHQFGPPNSVICVGDMKGSSMGHLFRISLSATRQVMYFLQEAAPFRIHSGHHLNCVPITEKFIALSKPFVKKELFEKVKFYTNSLDGFYEYVSKDCLPEDYGGCLPSLEEQKEKNMQNLLNNLDLLKWHETQKVDESKRIKKEKGLFRSFFSRS